MNPRQGLRWVSGVALPRAESAWQRQRIAKEIEKDIPRPLAQGFLAADSQSYLVLAWFHQHFILELG